MTVKKMENCLSGSQWYMAVREIKGKARSMTAIRKAQLISSRNRPRWGRK